MEPQPVVKGMLDALVLRASSRASMHGFEITEWIEERSGGALELAEAAVYQSLYRLEARGLIAAEWAVTPNNRRARYYSLTRAGRKALADEGANWERLSAAISAIVRTV